MLLENQPDVPLAIQTALLLLVYMAWMLSVSCPLISYCSRTSHCLSLLTRLKADGDYGHVPSASHTVFGVQRLNRCTSFPSWSQTGHHWEDVLFLLECAAQGSLHTISLHGWVVICFCRYCSLFCYPSSLPYWYYYCILSVSWYFPLLPSFLKDGGEPLYSCFTTSKNGFICNAIISCCLALGAGFHCFSHLELTILENGVISMT